MKASPRAIMEGCQDRNPVEFYPSLARWLAFIGTRPFLGDGGDIGVGTRTDLSRGNINALALQMRMLLQIQSGHLAYVSI